MIVEAIMPHIYFIPSRVAVMTASLIALALAGLVAIVVWDALE